MTQKPRWFDIYAQVGKAMVAWGQEVDEGELPVEFEIDEEGQEATLSAWRTDNPQRILLRVWRKYEDLILLEGIVDRRALATAWRAELHRFFTEEFKQEQWDTDYGGDPEEEYILTRDSVLAHPWMAAAGQD